MRCSLYETNSWHIHIYMISIHWCVSKYVFVCASCWFYKICHLAAYAFSPHLFNLHSTFGWHVVTFCTYSYNCEGDDQYRQVNATVRFRNITFIPNLVDAWHYCTFQDHNIIYEFFSWKPHSGSIVYWDREFLTTDTGWHFEERCIWYNYTLFIRVIFQEQKTLIIIGKQCYRNDG